METLGSSYANLLLEQYRDSRERGFPCPNRPEVRFLQSPSTTKKQHANLGFSVLIPVPRKKSPLPIFSASSDDPQIEQDHQKLQVEDTNQSKTVHVKFQLERECLFGQQFHVVGDDPMFGLWEPSEAVPLNWSDGHIWTAELDIPIGKLIKFKFILNGGTETMWQPGPDRILQTWETKNTITVCEDWDNAELQKLVEEETGSIQDKESTPSPEMLAVEENLNQPSISQMTLIVESTTTTGVTSQLEIPSAEKPMTIIAENMSEPKEKPYVNTNNTANANAQKDMTSGGYFSGNGSVTKVEDLASTDDEESMVACEDMPVLVPGLTPFPVNNEVVTNEAQENILPDASVGTAQDLSVPEEEPDDDPSEHPKERTDMMLEGHQELQQTEQVEKPQSAQEDDETNKVMMPFDNPVLKNDIQWGRRTLQKLLSNLGLQ